MDAPSDIFNIIEGILPDLSKWEFPFENSSPAQICSWLKEGDKENSAPLSTYEAVKEDQTIRQYRRFSTSDFAVFNEFFPSVSPASTSSSSSSVSSGFEGVSPPAFYPENPTPQWQNVQPIYQASYVPYVAPYNSQPTHQAPNVRTRAGKAVEECSNCRTRYSTMWRWNTKTGVRECNACNLYEAHNNRKRPQELWKDKILKRRKRNHRQYGNN